MFKYRKFICDIHTFLKDGSRKPRKNKPVHVYDLYRGQVISVEQLKQLEALQCRPNECFAFNNFTATSFDREFAIGMALAGVNDNTNLVPVLFHITIDPIKTTHPFADIAEFSHFPGAYEILIDLGVVLNVDRIIPSGSGMSNSVICITMQLYSVHNS